MQADEQARGHAAAHVRRRRWRAGVAALCCVVACGTAYALTRPAITMTQQTFCGMEAHTHEAACYETVLICGFDEQLPSERPQAHVHTADCYTPYETLVCGLDEDAAHTHEATCYETEYELTCPLEAGDAAGEPEAPAHSHTDACYETRLICTMQEHQHSLSCYADPQADLEDASVWERTLPAELCGNRRADVVAVAESQLGYAASTRNYIVDENGAMHGYTRYGAWYGDPYGAWCAMFASFCLHYAGVPQTDFPAASGCIYWTDQLTQAGLCAGADSCTPQPGDLAFFDTNGDGAADHVGIVAELSEDGTAITTIEGNVGGCVVRRQHASDASGVLCYGILPVQTENGGETPDEPQPDPRTPLCGHEEHSHTADCYDETGALICTLEEHTHVESCYQTAAEKTPLCGHEAHTHTADCYDETGALICALEEHTHTDACYEPAAEKTPLCGLEEHTHTEDCYSADGTLVCELPEHMHTDACYEAASTQRFSYADAQLQLTLTVESAQPLPEGTELDVQATDAAVFSGLSDGEASDGAEQWIVRQLALVQSGEALDTAAYRMTAELSVTDSFLQPLLDSTAADAAAEADPGVTVSVMQVGEDDGLQELDSATIGAAEQTPVLTVSVQSGTIAVLASAANPHYTVQYYAYIPRFVTADDDTTGLTPLTLFDTSGKNLPKNGRVNPEKSIYLKQDGTIGNQKARFAMATKDELTQMYSDNQFEYIKAPNPSYINKLLDNTNYTLRELWVLHDGADPTSTNPDDWDVYINPDAVHFTNRKEVQDQGSTSGQHIVYLAKGSTIRLVYDTAEDSFTTPATFYDYDISDGQNTDGRWRTGTTGINIDKNYGKSRNGSRTWNSYCDVLAFGNDNCGTGMSRYKFGGVFLNKYSTQYKDASNATQNLAGSVKQYGCTFELASGLNVVYRDDGTIDPSKSTIVYNEWIVAPKLFNEDNANGKHNYEGSSLTFSQVGDTYTLSAASVNGASQSLSNLQYFNHPSNYSILTNNFWPMDTVPGNKRTDPLFGGSDTVKYQGFKPYGKVNYDGTVLSGGNWTDEQGDFPASDDGVAHNSFFGMQYAVEFTLTPDYIGPLDYTFFGDDDMWVFLDETLVCDIGGVHSSVGEYVNLWDYLDKDGRETDETHTLTFFYTERGASGSTCYMNFTLPSVSGVNIEQKTADLRVSKEVIGDDSSDKAFEFTVQFSDQAGNTIWDDYAYTRYDKNGNELASDLVLHEGSTFRLKAGEYVIIKYLPIGLRYTITETNTGGYDVTNTVNGVVSAGGTAQGTIIKDTLATAVFTNTMHKVGLTLQKLDQDGNPLSGATFELKNASDQTVYAVKTETNGSCTYTVPSSGATQIQANALYYIVSAVNQNYVIGLDTAADNHDVTLQTNTGAPTQQFRVYRQTDGSYSFQCQANKEWLDLHEGGLTDGQLVHCWANSDTPTTHDNQKWYLIANGDGTFKIKPRMAVLSKSTAVLDLNGATVAEGQKIQVWTDNSTNAQKWLLVPVNPAETPTTTKDLTVGTDGVLRLAGLLPGSYTLTETAAPGGYQQLTQDIEFHVDASGKVTLTGTSQTEVTVDSSGSAYVLQVKNRHNDVKLTLKKELQNSTTTQEFTFTVSYPDPVHPEAAPIKKELQLSDGKSETLTGIPYGVEVTITETGHDGFTVSFKDGSSQTVLQQGDSYTFTITSDVTITAVNAAGYELPSTGGGAVWYQLAGAMLLAMLAAYPVYSRIKSKKQKEKGTTRQ